MQAISRRTLIQGMGTTVTAGVAGALIATSVTPVPARAEEADPWAIEELGEPEQTIKTDVCIVGAGGTGLAAAMQCVQNGLEVVLLEKNSFPGGSFTCTEGMVAVGSHWQEEAGVDLTIDGLILRLMDYHHWIPDFALYEAFLSRTAETIDWLESLNCNFQRVRAFGNSECTCHEYAGDPALGLGSQFVESMVAAAEGLGITATCDTAAKQLIIADGKVSGVLALTSDGKVIQIDCGAVIIGTGGYGNNGELLHELAGVDPDHVIASGLPGHDGDGIKMAHAAGAALCWDAGVANFYGNHLIGTTYGTHVNAACSLQPVLWVNEKAKRYVNEDMFALNFPYCGMALKRQKAAFTIMDQAMIDRFANEGTLVEVGAAAPTGTPYETLKDDIQQLIDDGNEHVFIADTVEELAEKCGLDPAALAETLDLYNSYCENGEDPQFSKDPSFMIPIQTSPFYAFEVADGFFTTVGGIRVSTKAEALDENDEPIPGLYVGGMDSSGFYGDCYDAGIAPGSTAAWAIVSARIAADAAKEYLGK